MVHTRSQYKNSNTKPIPIDEAYSAINKKTPQKRSSTPKIPIPITSERVVTTGFPGLDESWVDFQKQNNLTLGSDVYDAYAVAYARAWEQLFGEALGM
jgi:hypothetical protein